MKRLLASRIGPIYQFSRVFRVDETGRHHNPEFTMLEWYRPGLSLHDLMSEVAELIAELGVRAAAKRISYRDVVFDIAGVDPLQADCTQLRAALDRHRIAIPEALSSEEIDDRDFWLDLIMGALVGPGLGQDAPCFVYDYPASQAALAQLHPVDPRVAERFELYWRGVELANGFHELSDAAEQRRRFEADRRWRQQRGRVAPPYDEYLLQALEAGLPDCSGVALGFDRLVMLLLDLDSIGDAMAFDAERI